MAEKLTIAFPALLPALPTESAKTLAPRRARARQPPPRTAAAEGPGMQLPSTPKGLHCCRVTMPTVPSHTSM